MQAESHCRRKIMILTSDINILCKVKNRSHCSLIENQKYLSSVIFDLSMQLAACAAHKNKLLV